MYKNCRVLDGHYHYSPQTDIALLDGFTARTDTDAAVIQAVSHSKCVSLIPGALVMKAMHPGKYFVFGSPDVSAYTLHREDLGSYLAEYCGRMMNLGCDGIKMLEGKPQMRKAYPVPDFDDPVWEPYWQFAEENQIPITFHVNDPEKFWTKDVSPWLIRQGWVYDDSYVNNEDQYAQVLHVLERHPRLRLILAHFFFMSAQLPRLDAIFDRFPNLMTDLTPGIEMFENFSAAPEEAAAFFAKHHGRIVYGTDIGGRCILTNEGERFNEAENLRRPQIVREYLGGTDECEIASDGNFLIQREPFVMRPLGLEGERLEEILSGNLRRQIGHEPSPVVPEAVREECPRWRAALSAMADADASFTPDDSQITLAERYFAGK